MKDMIIVGAGGFGRELLQWIKDINRIQEKWVIKGFIDDNPNALDTFECGYTVIGSIQEWQPKKNEVFACAIAHPMSKEIITTLMKSRGASFEWIVHPSACIGEYNKIGEGIVIYPHVKITVNTEIGDFVTLLSSGVGHDVNIGNYTTISSYCDITGGVQVGNRVFIGSHVTIVPGKKIEDDAYIGAGSVVISNVKSGAKVMGNPAKRILF